MLERAVLEVEGPVAVRYPRGGEGGFSQNCGDGPDAVLREGRDITLVSYGTMIQEVLTAARMLRENGLEAEVVKLNVITPLKAETVLRSVKKTGALLVAEDCVPSGSVGERLAQSLEQAGIPAKVALCNTGDRFTPHGSVSQLRHMLGLDGEGLYQSAMEVLGCG